VRGIAVEHRTRVYFDIANRWTALSYVMNEILETICRTDSSHSWRFYYNCACPRKPVGVPTSQLSDFALAFPSVYANWRGIYFAELELCGVCAWINGWTACSMNYAKIGLLKGTYARNISFVTWHYASIIHIYIYIYIFLSFSLSFFLSPNLYIN